MEKWNDQLDELVVILDWKFHTYEDSRDTYGLTFEFRALRDHYTENGENCTCQRI